MYIDGWSMPVDAVVFIALFVAFLFFLGVSYRIRQLEDRIDRLERRWRIVRQEPVKR